MAQNLTRSAVRIYGALTALGNGTSDVLTKLLPFFEPLLREINGETFDPQAFAKSVRSTYHWNFNVDIVEVFTPRLVDAGWLTSQSKGDNSSGAYFVSLPEMPEVTEAERSASEELTEIAERFRTFAIELSPLTTIPKDVTEYEDILIEWLIYVEAFSEKNIDFKKYFKPDDTGTMRTIVEVPHATSLSDEERFLCARFVQHEIREGGATAEALSRIASIGLLTEVVQDFVKPMDAVENSDLVVYLDAPNALEFLGVSGRAARENTVPVINELKRIGAQVRVFSQSLDEMKAVLLAVLQNPRPTGPTAQAIARGEVLREYVTQIASNPAPFLEQEGIGIVQRELHQFPSEHAYFNADQRDEIITAQVYQQNFNARDHDADITALVMRQRRGRTDSDIFRSRFIVMTRNGLLAQVVRKACVNMGLLSSSEVPPVVHRRVLAASMWLRTGLGAGDLEVPKRMLLASCERVLAVRKGVVEAVKKLTDALEDEEKSRQLDLLIQQDRSTQMLMDKTLGAPGVVTADNLQLLFEEMIHPHLEEERLRGKSALSEADKRAKKDRVKLSSELEAERLKTQEVNAELEKVQRSDEAAIVALCGEVERRLRRKRRLRWLSVITLGVIFALVAVLGSGPIAFGVGLSANVVLTVLTLSGGRLIGVETDQSSAEAALKGLAGRRGLSEKLEPLVVTWDGKEFSVHRPEINAEADLLV